MMQLIIEDSGEWIIATKNGRERRFLKNSNQVLVVSMETLDVRPEAIIDRQRCTSTSVPHLGDRLEQVLKAVGITEERYKELKQLAGFEPNCACPQRKYFLNRIVKRVAIGYAKGGIAGAWQAAQQLAQETREHFAGEQTNG